jgi:hypothetical protein
MIDMLTAVEQSSLATWVREAPTLWAYPTILFLHTVGLGFLVGLNTVIDLRILGVAQAFPLAPMRRLFPIMWLGFWVNAVSGVALLAADATTKLVNPVFGIKLAFIALGVLNMKMFKRRILDAALPDDAPHARLIAITSLLAWVGATTAGRLMGYLVPVAGLR